MTIKWIFFQNSVKISDTVEMFVLALFRSNDAV